MRFASALCSIAFLGATQASWAAPPATLKPASDPATWVTTDDYPKQALMLRQQGTTRFRLDIDPTGAVIGCAVTASSGSPALDQASCDLLKARARFEPGRNGKGQAIPGTYSSAVSWQIPRNSDPKAGMLGCAMGPIGDIQVMTAEGCVR